MTDFSLNLRGMELLTIQYLLDGKNSAYGYRFELIGLDKADFSGARDEEMLDTNLVQQAEEAGDLRKVKFYVTNRNSPDQTRAIQLNFYEDGHVTATKEALPEEFDEIVDSVATAKNYSQYLISLDDCINEYINEITLNAQRTNHRHRVNRDFERLIRDELDVESDATIEAHIYKMVLANIGIQLYRMIEDVEPSEIPDDTLEEYDGPIKQFFTTYAQYEIPNVGDSDYAYVAKELSQVIDSWKEIDDENLTKYGAIGLLQNFIDTHDLDH